MGYYRPVDSTVLAHGSVALETKRDGRPAYLDLKLKYEASPSLRCWELEQRTGKLVPEGKLDPAHFI